MTSGIGAKGAPDELAVEILQSGLQVGGILSLEPEWSRKLRRPPDAVTVLAPLPGHKVHCSGSRDSGMVDQIQAGRVAPRSRK